MALVSVIICTYNPRLAYFEQCLQALRSQTLSTDWWELILVDNCSDNPLLGRIDLSWHLSARIVREEKLGLTPARLRGIREASAKLLVFVDDDNILDPDYLDKALKVAAEKPFLGAWSGQCFGVFEEPPPSWTRRYFGNLVIREFDRDSWSNLPRLPETMPCGAGLCIRSYVVDHYVHLYDSGKREFKLDRTGDSLISGGDNDLAACSCKFGLGVGLISALKLKHLISPERLEPDYLARLAEGIMLSGVILAYLWDNHIEIDRYQVRLRHKLRILFLPKPHRYIQLSALRGQQKGLDLIAKLQSQKGIPC
jgi:glycosyltransferase involved in cell wall biosynthesis